MTDPSTTPAVAPGAPFAVMLRGALVPATVAGLVAVVVLALVRGSGSIAGGLLGVVVAILFFASGMFLLSRLVRSASPHAFFAVAMAVYFGQIIALLVFFILFRRAAWLDGTALALSALVVTIAWQAFSYRAMRVARMPIYDEPTDGQESQR